MRPIHWGKKHSLKCYFGHHVCLQELVRAYNLIKLGIPYIGDVVNDQGQMLFLPQATSTYALGMHYRPIERKIGDLLQHFLPIPHLADGHKLWNRKLQPTATVARPLLLPTFTSMKVYKPLQPTLWFQQHANSLWHLRKSSTWWRRHLTLLWKTKLPLKQKVFLWRCMTRTLSMGVKLAKRRIVASTWLRCLRPSEIVLLLLWYCPHSKCLLDKISRFLNHWLPSPKPFGYLADSSVFYPNIL